MTGFTEILTVILSSLAVIALLGALVAFYAAYARSSIGVRIREYIGPKSLVLALLVAAGAAAGSLLYSYAAGFVPCDLCWYQRVFLFPQVVILAVALAKGDRGAGRYGLALSIPGALIALYHTYIQLAGSGTLLPCAAAGAACSKVYFLEWGFITIPTMSLIAFLALIAFYLVHGKASRSIKRLI
ncbi:MAG TPA: disulfide bond formation protein B [Candidatus Paceibacterota bacterium]|jgi:disulfide bond formation protein DsbB|nr:disulfide bond formation protein B [Candidatus Paceibacterota bacterium]